VEITKITEISSSKDDDLDNDNDNENISVTGSVSPDIPDHVGESAGAFTSIIQKNRKSEFISQFPVNSTHNFSGATNPMINHALAAHLFFQNPLLPPPNQWLYNHLYNNYHDFPWLRHSLTGNSNNSNNNNNNNNSNNSNASTTENQPTSPSGTSSGLSFIKRSITLLTNNNNNSNNEKENDSDVQSSSSPPVTSSTKRSPSPPETPQSITTTLTHKRKRSASTDSLNNSSKEKTRNRLGPGVWRPY
jgi:hypothetical protein